MKTIQVRVDDTTRLQADSVLKMIGIDMPTAIRLYLKKIAQTKSIPFELKVDQDVFTREEEEEILQAGDDAKKGKNMSPQFTSSEEAKKYLNAA